MIVLTVILVQFLVHWPDFYRQQNTPPDFWYTGQVSWFDPWDLNVYFSAIGWGKRGGFLFENLYDTQSTQKMAIYGFYILMGMATKSLNLSNAATFHLGDILLSSFLAAVVWWFVGIFFKDRAEKIITFILIFIGGGLGWLFFPRIILPDLGQPGFNLASALRRPHEVASLSFFLLTLGSFWRGAIDQQKKFLVLAGAALFFALYFHPYSALSLGVILLSFDLYQWIKTGSLVFWRAYLIFGLVGVLYYLLIGRGLINNPGFAGLIGQIQYSPSPLMAVLGWGILSPLLFVGLITPSPERKVLFLKAWFVGHFAVIYLPFGFQKLLIRGLWTAVSLLTVRGLRKLCLKLNWNFIGVAALFLVFTSFSTLSMSYQRIVEPPTNRWIYLTSGEGEIIDYLKTHGEDEEGVLASYRLANIIPANTQKRVWAGHTFQSPNFDERLLEVNRFFTGEMKDLEAKAFLQKIKAAWVFWGPDEKALGDLTKIPNQNLLELVLETKTASLFKVR